VRSVLSRTEDLTLSAVRNADKADDTVAARWDGKVRVVARVVMGAVRSEGTQ